MKTEVIHYEQRYQASLKKGENFGVLKIFRNTIKQLDVQISILNSGNKFIQPISSEVLDEFGINIIHVFKVDRVVNDIGLDSFKNRLFPLNDRLL